MIRFPKSTFIKSFEWTGARLGYGDSEVKGDTFPMTWADDDHIYASAGDPLWGETKDGLDVEKFTGGPTDYKIEKVNPMNDYKGWGGDGVKPSGMICVNGILYLAFQNLRRLRKPAHGMASQHGSDAQIVYSCGTSAVPKGQWWVPALPNIAAPMFPGYKFGGPAFINFGKNNANARDEYVYAVSGDQWDNGGNLRLGRVPADEIMQREAWKFVCAFQPNGEPAWASDLDAAIPILSLHRWLGLPEMVYLAGIKRYLLLTWRLHRDFSGDDGTDLLIFESPEPWGPFSLVHFEEYWQGKEFTPYAPRIPLKWMAPDGKSGWLQFSGSWTPAGQKAGYYRSHVRPFKLNLA
jgi:hypothetical protein